MAPKLFQLLSCICLLFLLLPLLSTAQPKKPKGTKKPSPFDFLNHFQGCHKGDKLQGLHELKQYLTKFGYLNYHYSKNNSNPNEDDFDDFLEAALKTYQQNYHLNVTGTLDAETLSKMVMPRCGVPDIINGTSSMTAAKKKGHHHRRHGPKPIHTVSHYSFFQGFPRWPAGKTHLTYGFASSTHPDAIPPFVSAFDRWAAATNYFTFSQTEDYVNADIKIGFGSGEHGDGNPFDGPGGTLAHAYAPTDGRFHCDADEAWSIGALPGYFDLETVALHEIGHLLGLGHSSVEDAIMYPSIADGVVKGLHGDDVEGIRVLYNV